jgi:deazaflavin-dependent oxidoreductase (nitroreductase family)
VPADYQFKFANALHQTVHKLTGGRLGNTLMGMPVLMLTVKGRKSGQPRTVALTVPVRDGETLVVVASKGGDTRDPEWFNNVVANPDVEVEFEGARRSMQARAANADERAELWPRIVKRYAGYGQYETKAHRQIPVVILTPA